MVIENKEIATRIRLGAMLYVLAFSALLVLSIIFSWSSKHYYEYISTFIFVLSFVFLYLKAYNYVYYNDNGTKIIIRFASLLPLAVGNYSIEIPKNDFVKAVFATKYFGLRKYMVVYVSTPQGVAKFRQVSVSALNKEELKNLQASLILLTPDNQW